MNNTAPARPLTNRWGFRPESSRVSFFLVALSLTAVSGPTSAYDMNPVDVDCWGLDVLCPATRLTSNMKQPVHETLTLLAYDYYTHPELAAGGRAKTSADNLRKSGVFRDLVLGSEWNDDPDSLLRQNIVKAVQWNALFKNAQDQARCKKDSRQAFCKNITITDTPMMLYRSHFGDFQFLHAMASQPSETAQETKDKIMAWAKFTYTLSISSNDLGNEAIDGPVISSFSTISATLLRQGWTVGALFDPVPGGEWERSYNPLKLGRFKPSGVMRTQAKGASVKHIALGSLLHMVQDSYSDAHVERVDGCNPLSKQRYEIISFRDYVAQSSEDHGLADTRPDWLDTGDLEKNNPIWASAQLIQYSIKKVPWDKGVEQFLDKEVFPLANPNNPSSTGDLKCYLGTS
ncbi:hypothetical protein [Pseudomonas sp. AIG]